MALINSIFKDNSFQFVARYIYDSGENSALGVFSPVVKARENLDLANNYITGISSLTVTINDDYPTYAKFMEVYARRGNEGTLYRVKTFDIANDQDGSGNLEFSFSGDLFEALDSTESSKPFDAIPTETKCIEVARNRVFLGNNVDDLAGGDSNISISLNSTNQALTNSADVEYPISYLRYSSNTADRVEGFDSEKYSQPFANDSLYKVGVALYDEYLRTRGVEDVVDFRTGNFKYPVYPNVRVSKGGGTFPTWAKYYQLVMTKNLSKDYSTEGYASDYFWIKNDTDATRIRKLDDSTRGEVKFFVIDIAGMIRSGYIYNFQEGDRININFDSTGAIKIVRNLRVLGQADNLVYVEFSSKDGFDVDSWNDSSLESEVYRLFFEIYSPKPSQDVVIYYEAGKIRPITDFDSATDVDFNLSSTEGYLSGDMVWQNIEMRGYTANAIPADDTLPTTKDLDDVYKVLIRKVDGTKSGSEWDVNIGKALIEYDGKTTQRSISKIRWGGKYIQGTNINPISSFFFANEQEVDFENGEIYALQRTSKRQEDGSVMLAICERETDSLYLGESVVNDTSGSTFVATTDSVIGTVRSLKGGFGTSSKRSVVQYAGNVYFWDSIKKKVVRYSSNGLVPISDFGMKSYFLDKTGDCRGYYDPFHNMYFIAFDSDDVGNVSTSVGYSEVADRWVSFYNHPVDVGVVRDNNMILFVSQDVYKSLQESATFRLYPSSQDAYIQYVMNTPTPEQPINVKIYTSMDVVDYANANNVESNLISLAITNENGQTTAVVEANYLLESDALYSHIFRDSSSVGGLLEGSYMEGMVHEIKVNFNSSTQESRLNSIVIGTNQSQGHLN